MSLEYCHYCDRQVDTDVEIEHFDKHLNINKKLTIEEFDRLSDEGQNEYLNKVKKGEIKEKDWAEVKNL